MLVLNFTLGVCRTETLQETMRFLKITVKKIKLLCQAELVQRTAHSAMPSSCTHNNDRFNVLLIVSNTMFRAFFKAGNLYEL
jgi:hypothetical protein